jgi:hypothetical protein
MTGDMGFLETIWNMPTTNGSGKVLLTPYRSVTITYVTCFHVHIRACQSHRLLLSSLLYEYTLWSIWNAILTSTQKHLQPYHLLLVAELSEIDMAAISAVLSLDEHLSQRSTSGVPKYRYQSVYSLARYSHVKIRTAKRFTNSCKRFRRK